MTPTTPKKLTFGQFIRHLRNERNWNQEELQERAGLGAGTVANIEGDDTNPKYTTIEKLAGAFKMSSGQLQVQYEQFVMGAEPDTPSNIVEMPLRRATDKGLDPKVVQLAEALMRVPRSVRHAIEGILVAIEGLGVTSEDDHHKT